MRTRITSIFAALALGLVSAITLLPGTALMASTTILTLPASTYAVGQYNFASTAVPSGKTAMMVTLDLTGRDPASTLIWDADISLDSGQTWTHLDGATVVGQPALCGPDDGPWSPCPTATSTSPLPNPSSTTRRVRGSVTVSGTAYRTLASTTVVLNP